MFKYYFEQIQGVEIWPVISLTIFFTFFLGLVFWAYKVDKSYISEMEKMPMDENEIENAALKN